MRTTLMLTGDINLMNVTDPRAPFARVTPTLKQADVRFALGCSRCNRPA